MIYLINLTIHKNFEPSFFPKTKYSLNVLKHPIHGGPEGGQNSNFWDKAKF